MRAGAQVGEANVAHVPHPCRAGPALGRSPPTHQTGFARVDRSGMDELGCPRYLTHPFRPEESVYGEGPVGLPTNFLQPVFDSLPTTMTIAERMEAIAFIEQNQDVFSRD